MEEIDQEIEKVDISHLVVEQPINHLDHLKMAIDLHDEKDNSYYLYFQKTCPTSYINQKSLIPLPTE